MHRIGVIATPITLFTESGEVDWERTKAHLEWMLDCGVHAVLCGGTCAEFHALTREERIGLAERSLGIVNKRVPVYVCVSHTSTRAAIELANHAEAAGATGIFSVPPYYTGVTDREVAQYYRDLANAVQIPLMIYNNPGASGVSVSIPMLVQLAKEGTAKLIKESHGDSARIHDLRLLTPESTEIIYGEDYGAFEAILAGADGWVAGVSNFMPRHSLRLWELCLAGDIVAARDYWYDILPLINVTSSKPTFGGPDERPDFIQVYKAALDRLGRYGGPSRPPLLPLSAEDERYLIGLLQHAGLRDSNA